MEKHEIVTMYRDYVANRDLCYVNGALLKERLTYHEDMYRLTFASNKTTLAEVEQVASQHAKATADKLFDSMFESIADQVAFCLKSSPSRPTWIQNGNNKLCGMLEINGGQTLANIPMQILVLDEEVKLFWGSNSLPDRDRHIGPAIVNIKANKSFVGHHISGGVRVAGFSNWRRRCLQHNLWIKHLQ